MLSPTHLFHIAIVPRVFMGDSLLYVSLASNLAAASYVVTVYSQVLAPLQPWFPQIRLLPHPPLSQMEEILAQYDLVIIDGVAPLLATADLQAIERYKARYMMLWTSYIDPKWQVANCEAFAAQFPPPLTTIAKQTGSSLRKIAEGAPMAERMQVFCKERLLLQNSVTAIPITSPQDLIYQKQTNRIVIHPTSGTAERSWRQNQFIQLALHLKKRGFEPVFVLAPHEFMYWTKVCEKNKITMPLFADLNETARFLYESRLMIGNDSGIGHLASALAIPTLTLFNRRRTTFKYRPGFHPGELLTPYFSLSLFGQRYWRRFLPVRTVVNKTLEMLT